MKNLLTVLILIVTVFPLSAQWGTNNVTNTVICDTSGEQGLSKIAGLPGGGCYISWFDNRSGMYAVYLQRLDALGNKMFGPNGLLISNNPQSSSLVDWGISVDAAGNAIIVFTDERNSGNLNPFAYLVSPSGQFLWGTNGIDLNPTADYQANPVALQSADGNYYVSWIIATSPYKVGVHKISPNGTKLWANPLILTGNGEAFSRPVLLPTDSNCVLLFHTAQTGTGWAPNVKLRINKIAPDGTLRWGQYGIYVQDLGKVNPYVTMRAIPDGSNGAVIVWYGDQDNDNLQEAYAQRITSAGEFYFPMNGSAVSTTSSITSTNTYPAFDPVTNSTYVFYYQTNDQQTVSGMYMQKFDLNGVRQWTDSGLEIKPLGSLISYLNQQMHFAGDRALIFWIEGSAGGMNSKVYCDAISPQGTRLWQNPVVVSETSLEKLHMVSYIDEFYDTKLSWTDSKYTDRGIFAQNVNKDGTLGDPVVPVELTSFTASFFRYSVTLNWVTATEINNRGFEIERMVKSENNLNSYWEKIAYIKGSGTVTSVSEYTYSDNVTSGKYSYRLKQIDFDGSYRYFEPVNILAGVNNEVPEEFKLLQNYPNPFNPETVITYQLPENSNVTIKVYDILGNEAAVLVNREQAAGSYSVKFDASKLNTGIYFAVIKAGGRTSSIKMSLLK